MPVQQALTLYPVNTTTVDTGTGIDVRLLATAPGGATDGSQSVSFTNSNSNVERTFDPATALVTNTNNAATTLFKTGWALRLAQDMTPVDDTKADAYLPAQTVTVTLAMTPTQSGGTYTAGTLAPTFRVSLWRYNPATDTGTLIAAASVAAPTWNVAQVGGDLGTAKAVTLNVSVPGTVFGVAKGTAAEVLYLQVGLNTGTVPAPTLGTATFQMTLTVQAAGTAVSMPIGLGELVYASGSAAAAAAATGSGAPVLPASGAVSAAASASGALLAFKVGAGTAAAAATVAGALGAVKLATGTVLAAAAAAAQAVIVKTAVGTVVVSSGGGGSAPVTDDEIARIAAAAGVTAANAVWDELTSEPRAAGSYGVLLQTNLDGTVSSRATSTAVSALAGQVQTLLDRLTAVRAGALDLLDTAISSVATLVGSRASQASVTALGSPLQTADSRLGRLDVAVSTRATPADVQVSTGGITVAAPVIPQVEVS